ncbi:TIGR00730 family Rossman fold protein [Legionella maioricensis]|uniref:Cytokinin riboside 5'-monophosphate phosphoribohydrolase n=1 Tax=Legionella maioricensis TaxID=2896528 RepID=A0A9X2IAF9_9GAMM|nr:TIGR00730 family Rossman fold protein [Legionella maioricensis]MCL9683376.1 TIGR00730 family Rossman fold protein [Legionella maioricensis]MCL9685928.1 TIGR00730 family Rossman fold protein [Legionella maioricensis]
MIGLGGGVRLLGRMFRIFYQNIKASYQITKMPVPIVAILGASMAKQEESYVQDARLLARKLVEQKVSIVTGGGTGIMEAANQGALEANSLEKRSFGIAVGAFNLKNNPFLADTINVDYYLVRKVILLNYASGYIFFPGGFGTLDELFEIITMLKSKQVELYRINENELPKQLPIILLGKEFWQPLLDWIINFPLKNNLICDEDIEMLHITDDLDEVVQIIKERCFSVEMKRQKIHTVIR